MPDKDLELSAEVLNILLRDHTTGKNIFWATHDYESLGSEYDYHSQIQPELITGEHGMVIRPRVLKSKEKQTDRSKDMAEVFTPSWICDAQNNLVEASLLSPQKGEEWRDYVRITCLEITCGEAPYLVSRYDATTGETIPLEKRIGLLDRKLRVVSKNTKTAEEWLEWAEVAYKNIYGYEWQGDNLLLARQNMLFGFIEYHEAKFATLPPAEAILRIAEIISWNLWQMDGLRGVVPDSCRGETTTIEYGLFGEEIKVQTSKPCEGCQEDNIHRHNGIYCLIRDWDNNKEIRYIDLINK